MQGSGGFHGRMSANQMRNVADGETRMMKQMDKNGLFSDRYKQDIDMRKIKFEVLRPWINKKVIEIMGFEDDIVIEYVSSQLTFEKVEAHQKVEPKKFQMNLTPFLGKQAAAFCHELWDLLLSAQERPDGIPQRFVDEKRDELESKRARVEAIGAQLGGPGHHGPPGAFPVGPGGPPHMPPGPHGFPMGPPGPMMPGGMFPGPPGPPPPYGAGPPPYAGGPPPYAGGPPPYAQPPPKGYAPTKGNDAYGAPAYPPSKGKEGKSPSGKKSKNQPPAYYGGSRFSNVPGSSSSSNAGGSPGRSEGAGAAQEQTNAPGAASKKGRSSSGKSRGGTVFDPSKNANMIPLGGGGPRGAEASSNTSDYAPPRERSPRREKASKWDS
ncbi:unnamed protein product [Amoebophrya sp. A25]|nr:unnamed protein product [Amoebophrya sp. A25]|eukprot:GSA25T00018634001.1